jgi:predicted CXXCH cytochrome family protein
MVMALFVGAFWTESVTRAEESATPQSSAVPTSRAHTLFNKQCDLCHEPLRGLSEKRCESCHTGSIHNEAQVSTPKCWSCHPEHGERKQLAQVANEQCVSCHGDLAVKSDKSALFAKNIKDFAPNHPEFAFTIGDGAKSERIRLDAIGARDKDGTKITFPHEKHLTPDLKGPKGPTTLTCKDCHTPTADGKYMKPVSYAKGCQQVCHPLAFDPQFPKNVVPHVAPQYVRAYLYLTFSEKRDSSRPAPPPPPAPMGRLTRPVPSVSPINPTPGVAQQVASAERYLYYESPFANSPSPACGKCHIIDKGKGSLPQIVNPAIPSVWLPHSQFSHRPHRLLECAACHQDVAKSKKATNVLLPGIAICRECHRTDSQETGARQATAATDCVLCHQYHDRTKEKDWNGTLTIQRALTEGVPKKAGTVAAPKP